LREPSKDLARAEAAESRKKNLLGCVFLPFCGYANALAHGFVYDDHSQIEQNSRSSADAAREFDQTLIMDPSNSEPRNGTADVAAQARPAEIACHPLCYSFSESFVII
jgi:hypothetical protein